MGTPNMTDMDRKGEEKAWMGTVTMLNPEKKFGFLKADNGLPKDYTGDSLFFHFNVIKNSLGKMSSLTHGSKVKFILYKAKDGDKATLEKPKAFAVYLTKQPTAKLEQTTSKKGTDTKAKEPKEAKPKSDVSTGKDIKSKLASGNKKMKVSIFWDIENCRPKMKSILEVVANIRNLVLQGLQEQSFMVVCDVTSENAEVIKQLEDAHVSVQHRSRTKKDSSDEVLRQQMRKVVDTSAQPGRIVLISGDSDFSTDIHSFRFTKLWEVVLIHNAAAKEALKITATHALPFEAVMEKGKKAQEKKEGKKKEALKITATHALPSQRDALVKSVLQKVQLEAVEEASLLVCKSSHLSTVGEVVESLVVCLMETDSKTRHASHSWGF